MKVLFVCSGNTCRSPLAEVMLADRVHRTPALAGVVAQSAGVAAWEGAPVSEGAFLVAMERGLDLSAHRARVLTAAMVADADLILAMSPAHVRRISALGGGSRVFNLADYAGNPDGTREVPDPVGRDVAAYRETAEILDDLLARVVTRLAAEKQR